MMGKRIQTKARGFRHNIMCLFTVKFHTRNFHFDKNTETENNEAGS